jgi:hypothetical protein
MLQSRRCATCSAINLVDQHGAKEKKSWNRTHLLLCPVALQVLVRVLDTERRRRRYLQAKQSGDSPSLAARRVSTSARCVSTSAADGVSLF